MSSKAREQLELCAQVLFEQSAEKHFEGMDLSRQAAKLELLASLLDEEQIQGVLDKLADQGVVVTPDAFLDLTSPGGDA